MKTDLLTRILISSVRLTASRGSCKKTAGTAVTRKSLKIMLDRNKNSLKYTALLVLVIQTTTLVLILRYSRTVNVETNRYLSSTVIMVAEFLKLIICLVVMVIKSGDVMSVVREINSEIILKPLETSKLLIPSGLYTIQNNLLFLALSNLDAATYQVTYQMKILVTALFSVFLLNKRLVATQWIALLFLMAGVSLVQWPNEEEVSASSANVDNSNKLIGLLAVFICCISSGFSGVYFEKLIKSTSQSIWIRNCQMSLFGFLLGTAAVVFQDFTIIRLHGFFQGYNLITWIVICLHAGGGIVVALVMKYADNILKGFATSVSIVLSTIFSYCLLQDFTPSLTYFIGASIVIFSTILYSL
ncbi:putative UDP N-acetylglucosamine transporter-like protein [Leptotrombidium deliense]|uniref:Putative UDP N-acetylglucosamine transporter-like protein n=1 Tax=Leptotrombidium deliense TaxID=299467 RepID=A0A443S7F7_9ACAR|nr:putative UDP N-acetylglucosamine transporter-like protein [Leptotrombidium deliense]